MAVLLGDLLMRVSLRVRPYEKIKNSTNMLLDQWIEELRGNLRNMTYKNFLQYARNIVKSFDEIEILDIQKPKVGIVGEILLKYHPMANNQLVKVLEAEGAEVVVGDIADFLLYCVYNAEFKSKHLGKGAVGSLVSEIGIKYIEHFRKPIREILSMSKRFNPPLTIKELGQLAEKLISLGNQSGEGWLLTAEMMELIENGAENIVCVQPFGCLPNHITGKGMIKPIREIYPNANIVPIDYDPGASEVNQLNRLKLMLSRAEVNLVGKGRREESSLAK